MKILTKIPYTYPHSSLSPNELDLSLHLQHPPNRKITISHSPLKPRASLPSICAFYRILNIAGILVPARLLTHTFFHITLRTRWLRGDNVAGDVISTSLLGANGKRKILFQRYEYLSPESTSGLFARSLFWWLNPLFRLGFEGVVKDEDLFEADRELLLNACEDRFREYWGNRRKSNSYGGFLEIDNRCKGEKYPQNQTLMWAMLRAMLEPLTASILLRLQPFLVNKIVSLVSNPHSEFSNDGWGLIAASGIIYIDLALTASAS
ncbi:uncharacterized protein EAF01_004727 [Botrytis porri]|uniref:uncharacterized protein n=1 Tax=Botrytis porri TaxID=87229 RepID=UPI0018FFFD47|nr:uncharacterized protein EAF01_004727 [Botrytis porri]KAF7907140.1 hypothetical protein EAF01_004727 [Botrytis porri]